MHRVQVILSCRLRDLSSNKSGSSCAVEEEEQE